MVKKVAVDSGVRNSNATDGNATDAAKNYHLIAQWARYVVLPSYFGLLSVLSINTLVVPTCDRDPNTVIWLIQIGPLVMFVHGVITQNVRSHVWIAFLCLGYFLLSVNAVFSCPTLLSGIENGLIFLLFCSATLYIRWRSKELKLMELL